MKKICCRRAGVHRQSADCWLGKTDRGVKQKRHLENPRRYLLQPKNNWYQMGGIASSSQSLIRLAMDLHEEVSKFRSISEDQSGR